jgi:hypothetical protein
MVSVKILIFLFIRIKICKILKSLICWKRIYELIPWVWSWFICQIGHTEYQLRIENFNGKIASIRLTVGMSLRHFLDWWLIWEGSHTWGTADPGLHKIRSSTSHEDQAHKQRSLMVFASRFLPGVTALSSLSDGLWNVSVRKINVFLPK